MGPVPVENESFKEDNCKTRNISSCDNESTKTNYASNNKTQSQKTKSLRWFYSIYVPPVNENEKKDLHVYTDRTEALRFLKQNKRARYKAFTNELCASYFAQHGCNMVPSSSIKTSDPASHSLLSSSTQEKSLFKTPKVQELIKFRKVIEAPDFPLFKHFVDENPRYLISSGDTPSILQEGTRYNALHIAARFDAADIASYILEIISSSELTNRLYGPQEKCVDNNQRSKVLLDLYLNTPDKGCNETPLHFASKYGSLSVIKILIMYPECDRQRRNKNNMTALDIVCSRASGSSKQNREAITALLQENYYVPVLRSDDNTTQPIVGYPITMSNFLNSTNYIEETPLSPRIQVHALAGPMSEEVANSFRKKWKSPRNFIEVSLLKPSLYDVDKGLERIGRKLASECKVHWTEYWAFLDAFVVLDSTEGLSMLEIFLKKKFLDAMKIPANGGMKFSYSEDNLCEMTLSVVDSNSKETSRDLTPIPYDLQTSCTSDSAFSDALCGPIMFFEKFLEIFAQRIANCLLMNSQIFLEISKLETFLKSCSNDERFESIDLRQAHYRLSQLISSNLSGMSKNINKDSNELTDTLKMFLETITISGEEDFEDFETVKRTSICIISFVLDHLSANSSGADNCNFRNQSWLNSKKCSCKIVHNTRFRNIFPCRKKLLFKENKSSDNPQKSISQSEVVEPIPGSPLSNFINDTLVAGIENLSIASPELPRNRLFETDPTHSNDISFDSDSDESFITAPGSPKSVGSSDEEFIDLPTSTTKIFLAGNTVTKLDAAVLHAIADVNISKIEYPFIFYWKKACEEIIQHLPSEKWSTPNMKLDCNPTQKKLLRELLSPSWH